MNVLRGILVVLLQAVTVSAGTVEHVVHISVDGLHADLLQQMVANDTAGALAGFRRFVDEGATTFNARTDFTHTNTLPNHTCMLACRPVLQPAGQPDDVHHGYTSNSNPGPNDTHHNRGNPNLPYVAATLDVAHDHGLTTGFYASKSKFVLFEHGYDAAHGAPDTIPPDDGRDKIDRYVNLWTGSPANASNLHATFLADMSATSFGYVFVHYLDPDAAGHLGGWGSALWEEAVHRVDDYLVELFALVDTHPALAGKTAIVLTTDHGGSGFDHGDASLAANYTIPFFVWGPGVDAGADLYVLNAAGRTDPGSSRPDYDASPPPIRNGDSGNLAMALLGLPPVPGSTVNAAQDLRTTHTAAVDSWPATRGKEGNR